MKRRPIPKRGIRRIKADLNKQRPKNSYLAQIERIHQDGAEEDENDDKQDGHELSGLLIFQRFVPELLVHQH
jgi:hypothetical protein